MRKYTYEDDRTSEEIEKTIGFVVATDNLMSGWGKAPGKSVVAVPFISEEDRAHVEEVMNKRTEMKRVRIVYGQQYYPTSTHKDHLHIYNTTTSFRYKKNTTIND